jgi:hypothetical protein
MTPLDLSGWLSFVGDRARVYFGSILMNESSFWHVETVMKKVAVVLRQSKKPLRRGKKKPAV